MVYLIGLNSVLSMWGFVGTGNSLVFSKDMYENVNARANIICRYTLWRFSPRTFYTTQTKERKEFASRFEIALDIPSNTCYIKLDSYKHNPAKGNAHGKWE